MIGAPLIEAFLTPCTRLERAGEASDGMGGSVTQWQDGAKLRAAIVKERSSPTRTGDTPDVAETYRITTPAGAQLMFHDVLRRDSDGAVFRVTTNYTDTLPPACASFAFEYVTAERWDLV